MSDRTMTVTLPEILYERVRETATVASLSFDEVLAQSIARSLPMVEMAMNASGLWDTARVLHVSPTTVIKKIKKRHRSYIR